MMPTPTPPIREISRSAPCSAVGLNSGAGACDPLLAGLVCLFLLAKFHLPGCCPIVPAIGRAACVAAILIDQLFHQPGDLVPDIMLIVQHLGLLLVKGAGLLVLLSARIL